MSPIGGLVLRAHYKEWTGHGLCGVLVTRRKVGAEPGAAPALPARPDYEIATRDVGDAK